MDIQQAKTIQEDCFKRMEKGGMTPLGRMDCFDEFETTNPNSELVEKFYDVWAKDYDVDMVEAAYKNPADVCNEMEERFADQKKNIRILDVGAGTGTGGKALFDKGFENIDATDGSPGMLLLAKKLGVYKKVFPAELMVEGKPLKTIAPESYDVIVSSGSFYPFHLQGYHLPCFLDCVKAGGLLILSACPNNDERVGLRPVLAKLQEQGIIRLVKESYIPKWYREDDGTLYVLEKVKPLHGSKQ